MSSHMIKGYRVVFPDNVSKETKEKWIAQMTEDELALKEYVKLIKWDHGGFKLW